MPFEFADERETMGYNWHIFFILPVEHSSGGIEGGLLLGALGISKPAYYCTILLLLAIFERLLRRGRYIAYNVWGVWQNNHEKNEHPWCPPHSLGCGQKECDESSAKPSTCCGTSVVLWQLPSSDPVTVCQSPYAIFWLPPTIRWGPQMISLVLHL